MGVLGCAPFLNSVVSFLLLQSHLQEAAPSRQQGSNSLQSITTKDRHFSNTFRHHATITSTDLNDRDLVELLEEANLDRSSILAIDPFHGPGFCNRLYKVQVLENIKFARREMIENDVHEKTTWLVAKTFSSLALQRLDPQRTLGEMDRLLDQHQIGPQIFATTESAILMEHMHGNVLTERMVHDEGSNSTMLCAAVGHVLGKMHSLLPRNNLTKQPNMLWHALKVMLATISDDFEIETNNTRWTLALLQKAIQKHHDVLEKKNLPVVVMGHGDFKPSNVIVGDDQVVRLLDFELSGTHYRGYDLAKFFRRTKSAATTPNSQPKDAFFRAYNAAVISTGMSLSTTKDLQKEATILEPITWLEAAVFFVSMASTTQIASEKSKWLELARDRLCSYEEATKDCSYEEATKDR